MKSLLLFCDARKELERSCCKIWYKFLFPAFLVIMILSACYFQGKFCLIKMDSIGNWEECSSVGSNEAKKIYYFLYWLRWIYMIFSCKVNLIYFFPDKNKNNKSRNSRSWEYRRKPVSGHPNIGKKKLLNYV